MHATILDFGTEQPQRSFWCSGAESERHEKRRAEWIVLVIDINACGPRINYAIG